jgi:hypothetical protein
VGRTLLSDAFDFDFDFRCHSDEAESHAQRAAPDEEPALSLPKGPMQLACSAPTDAIRLYRRTSMIATTATRPPKTVTDGAASS